MISSVNEVKTSRRSREVPLEAIALPIIFDCGKSDSPCATGDLEARPWLFGFSDLPTGEDSDCQHGVSVVHIKEVRTMTAR